MKTFLLIVGLAFPAFAGGPFGFDDPKLNHEFQQNAYEHSYPNIVNGRASTMTITQLNVSSITATGYSTFSSATVTNLVGTKTNDAACAGCVGRYVSSAVTNVTAPTSDQYGDATSISLTAGDWEVEVNSSWEGNGATWSGCETGVSQTTGNDATGLTLGSTNASSNYASTATAVTRIVQAVPGVRFSLSGTTTIYLKMYATYSAGSPRFYGKIAAWRVR